MADASPGGCLRQPDRHGLFRQGRVFGCGLRHQWFGLLGFGVQGFTPTLRHQGLRQLLAQSFLPHSTHESPVLLASLNRSGLRPSFPARPICFSAFRLWSASLALPTAWPNTPSADFCIRGQDALRRPQFQDWNAGQTSRGKFSRPPCAVAESTLRVLDEYGLCDSLPARPTLAPHIRFLSINSHFCSALPSDPASRR
jgi:hypothetical protein